MDNDPLDALRQLGAQLPALDHDVRERIWRAAAPSLAAAASSSVRPDPWGRTRRYRPIRARGRGRQLLLIASILILVTAGVAVASNWLGSDPASKVDQLPIETTKYTPQFFDASARASGGPLRVWPTTNHVVMRDLGASREALEIARRSDGSTCVSLHGAGSCTTLTNPGQIWWATLRLGPRDPQLQVFGAVGDDIQAVDVQVNGTPTPARVANNGFYLELPPNTTEKDIESFISVF